MPVSECNPFRLAQNDDRGGQRVRLHTAGMKDVDCSNPIVNRSSVLGIERV